MARVVTDDKHYRDIAAAIKSYDTAWEDTGVKPAQMAGAVANVYDTGFINGYAEAELDGQELYNSGLAAGKKAERNRRWDVQLDNGSRTNFMSAFAYYGWTDDNFDPNRNLKVNNANGMFRYNKITDLKSKLDALGVSIDFSDCADFTQMGQGSSITHYPVINMSNATSTGYAFGTNPKVKSIETIIVSAKTVFSGQAFNTATDLQHVVFAPENALTSSVDVHWSPLDKESLTSLAKVLSPTATGTLTVKKTAVEAAFPNRAEWDALFTNKPNWTVSEV